MNKLILLIFIIAPLLAFSQTDQAQFQGEWVLSDIQSNDSIWVAINPNAQSSVSTDGKVITSDVQEKRISIVEYLQKDLSCGITQFVFKGTQFEFYRSKQLTFKGTFTIKGTKLILEYENGSGKNTKENTIVSLSNEKLVLESESKERPVTLSFFKK